MVDPGNALQAVVELHDLLGALIGPIAVCDPYFDGTTVEHLGALPKRCKIRVLTMNVRDSGPLRRVVAAAQTTGYDMEIRVVAQRVLHDRYIVDSAGLLILGCSLNGFGKKQSFVVRAGSDIRGAVLTEFDNQWAQASTWP